MKGLVLFISLFIFSTSALADGLGRPITKVSVDSNCANALAMAERIIIERLPDTLSREQVSWTLKNIYRLVGIWYSDTGSCEVYDLIELESDIGLRSPHEILEEDILEVMVRDGVISRYEPAGNGSFYRLYR